MKNIYLLVLLVFFGFTAHAQYNSSTENDSVYAGFRASRLYHIYPDNKFPPKEYWLKVGLGMADKFEKAQPAGIWIVGLYMNSGHVSLGFPSPGGEYDKIDFSNEDLNEDYLTYFDENNIKVWLQVEPGSADIDTLMMLVMERYKHHPSVIGFGIDIEWYKADVEYEGAKVTDNEAEHWDTTLRQIDTSYSLFIKHYNTNWMPPTYRGNIFFVDDSQIFNNLQQMVNEYIDWGETFAPNYSGFQFGYNADRHWWSDFDDPPKTIGQTLFDNIPECKGVFWVDFTVTEIFPLQIGEHKTVNRNLNHLYVSSSQTHLLPTVNFKLNKSSNITIVLSDIKGSKTIVLNSVTLTKGEHRINLGSTANAPGVYVVTVLDGIEKSSVKFIINP
jgi:hypothetical protein